MPKMKPLTPKQLTRRRRIFSAARDMIGAHGYEGMVMSQVAEAASVSPTTLYNLFNTKDQLIIAALQDFLLDNARETFKAAGGLGWRFMVGTVVGGARLTMDSPAYSEAMLTALQRSRSGDPLVRMLIEDGCKSFRRSLAVMQAQSELHADLDVANLAVQLNGVYWSSFFMWNKGVLRLADLEKTVLSSFLAVLIPHATGSAHLALQNSLRQVQS